MARMFKRGRRKRKILSMKEISLTPLIDTALTLLIIFMITAPMMQNSIKVSLPKGDAKEVENSNKELIVVIDKDEKIYFNKIPMQLDQLIKIIQNSVAQNAQKTVFVEADENVHYGKVIDIVDGLKVIGGVEYVALATKRRA